MKSETKELLINIAGSSWGYDVEVKSALENEYITNMVDVYLTENPKPSIARLFDLIMILGGYEEAEIRQSSDFKNDLLSFFKDADEE